MATPIDDAGDLISALNDDLLVRILDLLPDASDVVRTDTLSRRWRGLWTGVAALRFDSDYKSTPEVCRDAGAAERYLAFVNDALALRAKAATTGRRRYAVKELAICFNICGQEKQDSKPPRYAAQNEVESLILALDLPWHDDTECPVMAIDELSTSAKLEILRLSLAYAQLGLFSSAPTVVFGSLADLSLGSITVGGNLLSRLVSSSCCPRLRKLHLYDLRFSAMEELLLLEADALLDLSVELVDDVQSLELRTPSLRVLRVDDCSDLEWFRVSSPRLDDLMFYVQQHLHIEDVYGHLSSVATLKIKLTSHRCMYNGDDLNNGSFDILRCCKLTRCLEVSLNVIKTNLHSCDIIKGQIPPLPHVTSLTLDVTLPREPHLFGSGIGSFLAQCSSIRYLRLQLCYGNMKDLSEQDLLCESSCQWKSHEFHLVHLQEIEFKNLIGTDCQIQFIQSILKREIGVQKVAISFDPHYWIKDSKDAFELMPSLEGGSWTTCNDANLSYKWRRE